jgi:hypothetical protein
MGDDDGGLSGFEKCGAGQADAGDEAGAGFAFGWAEADGVGGPGVEEVAGDLVPVQALPGAKIEFLEAGVDDGFGGKGVREAEAAEGRAGDDAADAGRRERSAHGFQCRDAGRAEVDIEAAVTVTRRDVRSGVPDQVDRYAGSNQCDLSVIFDYTRFNR